MTDPASLSALLGGNLQPRNASPYDLLTGKAGNVTISALLAPKTQPSLRPIQADAVTSLENFINNNVADKDTAAKLKSQLAAARDLMDLFNTESRGPDPIFALLANNPKSFESLPGGSVVNTLV